MGLGKSLGLESNEGDTEPTEGQPCEGDSEGDSEVEDCPNV